MPGYFPFDDKRMIVSGLPLQTRPPGTAHGEQMFLIASILPNDYKALRSLCPDLPDSFDEWSDQQLREQQRCESQEKQFLKVPVTPLEFSNYCKSTRQLPNLVTFRACVMANSGKARKGK
jgi:hypothetical protein